MKRFLLILFLSLISFEIIYAQSTTSNDDMYCHSKDVISKKKEYHYWDNAIVVGIGGEFGKLKTENNDFLKYWGVNLIIYNTFITYTLSEYDAYDTMYHNIKLGHYINVINFGNYNDIMERYDSQIKIAPFIEFTNSTHVDGHYLHNNVPHHVCTAWVDTTTTNPCSNMNFGLGVLYRYKCFYAELKGTLSLSNVNIGFGVCL